MAVIEKKICGRCHEEFISVESHNITDDFCSKCDAILEKESKEKFLAEWRDDLTLEQRVAQIEEWIYQMQKQKPNLCPHGTIFGVMDI